MPLQTCAECPLKSKHGKKITAYKGRAKAGTADPADVAKLAELEAQAKALREELVTLA